MSIIHEALKKVQSNKPETRSARVTSGPIVPTPSPLTQSQKRPIFPVSLVLWAGIFLVISSVTGYNLFEMITRKSPVVISQPPKIEEPVVILPAQPVATTVSVKPAAKKNDIILTGIVLMDGKKFALINNQFYEKGETVAGAKLTQITDDSIEIEQKGKTRTIKVIRPE